MIARVFLDTDAIISATLSHKGAAFQLMNHKQVEKRISNLTTEEAQRTAAKLGIDNKDLQKRLTICTKFDIKTSLKSIRKSYGSYVYDATDSHVLCGAVESKSQFLITYNLKDYKIDLIKRKFNIIVTTPGMFLQFVRSRM